MRLPAEEYAAEEQKFMPNLRDSHQHADAVIAEEYAA